MGNGLVEISRIELSGIPCLIVTPKYMYDIENTVFLYHGWSSSKDSETFFASIIASYGFRVIVPDSIYHGERGKLNYADDKEMKKNFWKIVINSTEEFEKILKSAENELGVNINKVSVVGNSMGGFICSGIFALHENIRTMVILNGGCAWDKADEIFRKYGGEDYNSDSELPLIRKYDLGENIDKLHQRPILLMHGDADTTVPIEIQRYFYSLVEPLYENNPQNIKFIEMPKLNHYKTIKMAEETVNWLDMMNM